MAITTQTVKIDLNTGKTIPVVYAHQNDTNRAIQFQVFNNGEAFNLSGYTVKFGYVSPKKNGQYITINGDGMASGITNLNLVSVTLPETYTSISGTGLLTMIISGSGATIRPVNIRFEIQSSSDGEDVISGSTDLPDALQQIADAWYDENIHDWLNENLGSIFTEEEFLAEIDAWLDDHPEATTTVEDGSITVSKLHEDVADLVEKINVYKGVPSNSCYPMVADKYVITDTAYAHGQGMCFISNDIFVQATVTGTEGDNAKLYVVDTSTSTVLSTNLLPVSHANSLTYNPSNGKIYVASRGHVFVVGINATTYELTVEDDLSFDTFFQGIAYYNGNYYLYGNDYMWKSADLQTFEKLFPIDGRGYTLQGLCVKDGGIYLCASGNVNNIIWQYSFDGYLVQIRNLPASLYYELEEMDIVSGTFWSSCVDVDNGKMYIRRVDADINLRKDLNSVRTTVNGNNLNKLSYKVVEDLDAEFSGEGIHFGMYRYNATSVPRGNAGMVLTGIWSSNYAVQVAFDTLGYVYIRYKSSGTISAWSMVHNVV